MEVRLPDESSFSRRSVGSALAAAALSTALVAPGIVVPAYARVASAALVAFGVVLAVRATASAVVAFVRRSPPTAPEPPLPAATVVVTAYNEAEVLPATVDACAALDYPDDRLEILVGYESASTDGTAAVAEAAADRDPRVVAVERDRPPGGKASATNHALASASGEIVAVLDADQRPEPGALRRAVRWFRDDDVACVKGRCFGTNPDASMVALCATVERAVAERAEFYARDLLGGFALFTGGQAFFRADALAREGTFDESILLEDLDMAYRLQRAGGEIRVDPGIVTHETNPAAIAAWWHQRKRWARGGMQVARRYLGANLLFGPPSSLARADFAATLGALLAFPILALASPLAAVAWGLTPGGRPFGLAALVAGGFVLATPLVASYLVLAVDARDGRRHERSEYVAPLLLWPYFLLQAGAVVAAFVDEFVVRRPAVYVTSASGSDGE
ncbi:glycosyltransferase [Halomarina pelagica]|uniref:glycosyltransferase n=1 Tax=Halomarina pelagica TaxID=2961599 RepID=UPI0020C493BE|nr:glycosyltransferase family 2 protein [Halomarina sp. BND7]